MIDIFRMNCPATGLFARDALIKVRKGSTCRMNRDVYNPHGNEDAYAAFSVDTKVVILKLNDA